MSEQQQNLTVVPWLTPEVYDHAKRIITLILCNQDRYSGDKEYPLLANELYEIIFRQHRRYIRIARIYSYIQMCANTEEFRNNVAKYASFGDLYTAYEIKHYKHEHHEYKEEGYRTLFKIALGHIRDSSLAIFYRYAPTNILTPFLIGHQQNRTICYQQSMNLAWRRDKAFLEFVIRSKHYQIAEEGPCFDIYYTIISDDLLFDATKLRNLAMEYIRKRYKGKFGQMYVLIWTRETQEVYCNLFTRYSSILPRMTWIIYLDYLDTIAEALDLPSDTVRFFALMTAVRQGVPSIVRLFQGIQITVPWAHFV